MWSIDLSELPLVSKASLRKTKRQAFDAAVLRVTVGKWSRIVIIAPLHRRHGQLNIVARQVFGVNTAFTLTELADKIHSPLYGRGTGVQGTLQSTLLTLSPVNRCRSAGRRGTCFFLRIATVSASSVVK